MVYELQKKVYLICMKTCKP
ncbi:TRASH domain-containing protein [Psychrobacillus glaciei]|uniref:TRASH domain-containing protein n=1 Tax=Psychrobacillus glaciei TaxID=2283160 RepID=A0A5J6SXL7_9BACI|nr:TRASH domain-containing protein [Psychrobacillus glaciei]